MSFASRMQITASRLLTTYGQEVTFSRETQGTFIPSSGTVSIGASLTYTAKVQPSQYTAEEIDGVSILFSDVNLITYSETPPLVGDTVNLDGVVHRAESVVKIDVQGYSVIYKVQIRV